MNWLLESPWPSLVVGMLLLAGLAFAFMQTGHRAILYGMLAVAALTVGMVALERAVVTDREEVSDTLDGIAAALVAGDSPAVMAAFAPECVRGGEVRNALSRYDFTAAKVSGLDVTTNHLTSPASATAVFFGRAEVKDRSGQIPYEHVLRRFQVRLARHGNRWLIQEVTDVDPRERKK